MKFNILRQTSLGSLGIVIGSILFVVGLTAYFADNATLNLVGFFYGIPLLLGGLALKAAELKPISFSQPTTAEVLSLRQQQATATQNRIRQDVTRYRYGQEAHLDTSLSHLGFGPTEERPVLEGIRETTVKGAYALVLEFDSPLVPLEVWQQKQQKMTKFFGPGVDVEVTQAADRIELALIANPSASS